MAEKQTDPTAGDPIDIDDDEEDEEEEEEEEVLQDLPPQDPGPENPEASAVPENPSEAAAPPPAVEPEPEQKSAVPVMSEIRPASFAESLASAAPTTAESERAAAPDIKLEALSESAEDLPEPPQPDTVVQPEVPVEDEMPPPQDKTIEVVNLDGDKIEFLESQAEPPTAVENDQASIPESVQGDIESGQPVQPTDEVENGQSEQSPDGAEEKQPDAPLDQMEGGETELPMNEVENNQSEPPVDDAEGGQSEPPLDDAEGGQFEPPVDDGEGEQLEAEVPLAEVNEDGISGEARSIENGGADVGTTEGALEGSETSSGAAEAEPTGEPPLNIEEADAIPDANIEAVSEVLGTPKEIGSIKGSNSDVVSQDDEAVGRGDGMNEEELNDESKTDEQESSDQADQIQELPNDEQNQAIPNQVEMPPKVSQAPGPPPAAPATASCEPREPVSDVQSYLDPILGYDRYPCNLCNSSEDDEDPFAASIQFAYELFGHLVELVMSKLSQNNNPNEQ